MMNTRRIRGLRFRFPPALLVLAAAAAVVAGPPFVTDDPEPVDYRHLEFYCASQLSGANGIISGTAPSVEVNYGLLSDVQIHAIARLAVNSDADGHPAYGPGDLELGVKYRFIRESAERPQAGIFPAIELPTGDSSKELGAGTVQLFLPLWLQKSFETLDHLWRRRVSGCHRAPVGKFLPVWMARSAGCIKRPDPGSRTLRRYQTAGICGNRGGVQHRGNNQSVAGTSYSRLGGAGYRGDTSVRVLLFLSTDIRS